MTSPALYLPTDEFVAQEAARAVLGVPVATSLPKLDTWPVWLGTIRAFGTVTVVGGGNADTPYEDPVVSVGTWAAIPGQDAPQWGAASQLASVLWHVAADEFEPRSVRQSAKYVPALVLGLSRVARPRRVPDPDASVAHFETEIRVHYVPQN